MFSHGLDYLKKGGNSIQDEDRPGKLTMASTPELMDLLIKLIFVERRIYNRKHF